MTIKYEDSYAALVADIMEHGDDRPTRNHPTRAVFGRMLVVHELCYGQFPILNGRKMYPKGIFGELAAFLKGPKSVQDFKNEGCNYWDKFGDADGNLSVDYGNSWIDFNGTNQLEMVLNSLAEDPTGRRHIITGWRPDNLHNLTLPCCHLLYQWYVNKGRLEMIWYQRSVDTMVGLPSDVVLAAAWNIIMADQLGLQPGKLVFMLGDTHIYQSHFETVYDYLEYCVDDTKRCPGYFYEGNIYHFNKNSIKLLDYDPYPPLEFELHV